MAIPANILKLLDDWKIDYLLTDDKELFRLMHNPPASCSAKVANMIFLQDDQDKVQVVVPGNRILDLNQLAQQLGRRFIALSTDELDRLKKQYGLSEFPALPQVTQLESLIDSNLLAEDELFIVSGDSHEWLKIPMEQFRTLTTTSHIGNYTAPLLMDIHNNDFRQDLEDVHSAIRQFTPLRIQQRLAETLDLPPLPETAHRIIDLRVDPNADTVSLAEAIELDPGMSAQTISWARSPYYGAHNDIESVEDAVLRVLGFDLVINLALGLSLGRTLAVPKEGPHGYAPFWQQAVVTATLCGELTRLIPARHRPSQGLAYLGGLLHNFGFLILGHVFPPQFALVNRHIEVNPHINRFYIEQHLLAMTREQIASCLLQQWRMPDELVTAIRQQHNPDYHGPHAEYARLLYIATRSLRRHGFGDGPFEQPQDYLLEAAGLNASAVDDATRRILEQIDNLNELIQMIKH